MQDDIVTWYAGAARDLPWRAPDRTPWGVLVSEVMLQQTPVSRVEPVWRAWLARWPGPADLAVEPPGEAVRAWGRLGYPRRALRLHAAAGMIVDRFGGSVPANHADLRSLPGIGDYTAAAIASFAFGAPCAVLDTNVRRVLARAVSGTALPPPSVTAAERRLASSLLPETGAPTWSVAVMELGALVCTAKAPRCAWCPVAHQCTWRLAGSPPHQGPPPRRQAWEGTDRQVRGRLLAVLRHAAEPVPKTALDAVWPTDPVQRERALDGLVADGLVQPLGGARYQLPQASPATVAR